MAKNTIKKVKTMDEVNHLLAKGWSIVEYLKYSIKMKKTINGFI